MSLNGKIYFVSDAHLGVDHDLTSIQREALLIKWLDEIKKDAIEINLVGDIFDFWFEYKHVVPRGYSMFFAKLREISESGIILNYFTGNHDMWIFDYLPSITGAKLYRGTIKKIVGDKTFFIGHGDGLGPYDKKYNFLKHIFSSKFFQFLFRLLHPEVAFRIALTWSSSSRKNHSYLKKIDYNEEWLVKYAKTVLANEPIDFFIFGHRHIPFQLQLNEKTLFTNLGYWLFNFTYAVYDGEKMELKKFTE